MSSAKIEQDRGWFQQGIEKLIAEIAILEAQLAELEQQHSRAPVLLQKLGLYLGFGTAEKLEWARFRLKLKQQELDRFKTRHGVLKVTAKHSSIVPETQHALPHGHTGETARQKMARMITENPPGLEPHLRRIYQPLIEAEELNQR